MRVTRRTQALCHGRKTEPYAQTWCWFCPSGQLPTRRPWRPLCYMYRALRARVRACVGAPVRACVRACVRASVGACVRACARAWPPDPGLAVTLGGRGDGCRMLVAGGARWGGTAWVRASGACVVRACVRVWVHRCELTCLRAFVDAPVGGRVRAWVRRHERGCAGECVRACLRACVRSCVRACVRGCASARARPHASPRARTRAP